MMRWHISAIFLAGGLSGCQPADLFQTATIKQNGDTPCFTMLRNSKEPDARPRLSGIYVGERLHVGGREIWKVSFVDPLKEPLILSPEACIEYGAALPLGEIHMPPVPLEVGKRYEVSLYGAVEGEDGRLDARSYNGRFCLSENPSGRPIVHEVFWDERKSVWKWDVCGLANDHN